MGNNFRQGPLRAIRSGVPLDAQPAGDIDRKPFLQLFQLADLLSLEGMDGEPGWFDDALSVRGTVGVIGHQGKIGVSSTTHLTDSCAADDAADFNAVQEFHGVRL